MPDGVPTIHVIVFSKNRPLQLHGYLTSLFHHWWGDVRVSVLAREAPPYEDAYADVCREFTGRTQFWREDVFAARLRELLGRVTAPYTCFGTDDAVFTLPVDVATVDAAFRQRPDLLGVSLRLGRHTQRDMFGRPMAQPRWRWDATALPEPWLTWNATDPASVGDWAYPWEVVGTVYPTEFVRSVVDALVRDGKATSPSQLEDGGWRIWREHTERRTMAAFATARLVVPTVNLVQSEFGNGTVGSGPPLEPAFLLECWNRGLRLDVQRYQGMAPPSWRVGDFYLRRAA